jgi:hypothetical protein
MTELRQATRVDSSLGGLVDALDTIIDEGAVVAGDIIITLDGIDLIRLDLRLLLAGIEGEPATGGGAP